jgi:hypothetical protein
MLERFCRRIRTELGEDAAVLGTDMLRWMLMGEWQDSRCAICGCRTRWLVEDHDHRTGLFRGFLCQSCNTMEPGSPGVYAMYREHCPAIIFNIKRTYGGSWSGNAIALEYAHLPPAVGEGYEWG